MPTDRERVSRALDLLMTGLYPYFEGELRAVYGQEWADAARHSFRNDRAAAVLSRVEPCDWDAQALLTVMWDQWNAVFRQKLGLFERSLVSELREFRNRWAHQAIVSEDDSYRVIDSVQRLLLAVETDAGLVDELERLKLDILREKLGKHVDDAQLEAKGNRDRLMEIGLFVISGASILLTTILFLGPKNPLAALILCGFVLFTFTYLIVRRVKLEPPIHGVHECGKCHKVIYTEVCPYCEAPPSSSSIIRRGAGGSSLRFPPLASRPESSGEVPVTAGSGMGHGSGMGSAPRRPR